jgi:microcystin-dependent protein
MNRLEIQGSGFPATNKTWRFLSDMVYQIERLSTMGGRNYVVSGCEINGNTVASGFVVLRGELMPFVGGNINEDVTVIQNVDKTTYLEDANNDGLGDAKDTYFTRSARFGTGGVITYKWIDVERFTPLTEINKRLLPPGSNPQIYTGNIDSIPDGWFLCNGTNGTPNLSGKFLVGLDPGDADHNAIGKTGGQKKVKLSEQEMPQHKHSGSVSIPAHSHGLPGDVVGVGGTQTNALSNSNNVGHKTVSSTSSSGAQTGSISTANVGGNQSHENRPPYYTLAYIIYMG